MPFKVPTFREELKVYMQYRLQGLDITQI